LFKGAVLADGVLELLDGVALAALLFEDETETPVGGGVAGLLALGWLGEVGAEVLLGVGELGGGVAGEDDAGGVVVGAEVVGDGGVGLFECLVEIVPAAGGGIEDGELAVGGDARGVEGDGAAGFGLGEWELIAAFVEVGATEAGVGFVVVGAGGDGGLPERLDGGFAFCLVFFFGGEDGLHSCSANGIGLGEAVAELPGFGLVSADEARGVPVELSGVLEGVERVGIELEAALGLLSEAAGEAHLLEGASGGCGEFGTYGVRQLGVRLGVVVGKGDGFLGESDGSVEAEEGPFDNRLLDEAACVIGALLERGLHECMGAKVVGVVEESVGCSALGAKGHSKAEKRCEQERRCARGADQRSLLSDDTVSGHSAFIRVQEGKSKSVFRRSGISTLVSLTAATVGKPQWEITGRVRLRVMELSHSRKRQCARLSGMGMNDSSKSPQNRDEALDTAIRENLVTAVPEVELPSDDRSPAAVPPLPQKRRAAATFIFLTVTLDMLAMGMIAPVLPRLIAGFLHGDASSAAQMLGIFGTVFAAMQFFFSPALGSLSDRFGRRPVVLLSNFGLGFDYLLMAWAPALGWLFLGRVISGLTASSVPTAMAYMTDVTPAEKRASAFGLLGAAFGMGFVLGPALGGVLGSVSPRLPFWVSGGLSIVNGLYGLFVLPESLSKEHRSPFSWKRANPVGSLGLLRRSKVLMGLAALLLLGYLSQQSLMNVYVIYADYRFHWTDRTVGLSLALVGLMSGLYGALLVKRAVAALGERGAISVGLMFGAAGYAMFGLSKTGMLMWLAIPILNGMSVVWPTAQSIMSREVGPSEQGQMQGAVNSLRGIAGLVGPGMFTYVFSKSIGVGAVIHAPGAAFFLAASLLIASLVVAEVVRPQRVAVA